MSIQAFAAAWLLLIYGAGAIGMDVVHQLVHHHGVHVDSDAPHDTSNDESIHASKLNSFDTCKYSHVVFHSDQVLTDESCVEISFKALLFQIHQVTVAPVHTCLYQSLCGPPLV